MKDYSSMTIQERIEDMFAYLAVCRQMEAMLPERIEILEMGLKALEEKDEGLLKHDRPGANRKGEAR